MKKFLSRKLFVLVLVVFAITIVPFHDAHAGDIGDWMGVLTGGIINIVPLVPLIIPPGVGETIGVLCLTGIICGDDDGGVTPGSGTVDCSASYSPSFSIPSFGFQYKKVLKYCYTNASDNYICDRVSDGTQRYREPMYGEAGYESGDYTPPNYGCSIPDANGSYVKIGGVCYNARYSVEKVPVDETQNSVVLYRFVQPSSISDSAMANWYFSAAGNVGSGFLTLGLENAAGFGYADPSASYYSSSDSGAHATMSASACGGGSCSFSDNDIPSDSYVIYAAKILGNYSGVQYSSIGDGDYDASIVPGSNKFLNTGGDTTIIPNSSYTLGNLLVGPIKSGSCSVPVSIITQTIPTDKKVGESYSAEIGAMGGGNKSKDSYVWSIVSGSLPPNVNLSQPSCSASPCKGPAGINGTPTVEGKYDFKIKVVSGDKSDERDFTIKINKGDGGGPPPPTSTSTATYTIAPPEASKKFGETQEFKGYYDQNGPAEAPGDILVTGGGGDDSATWSSSDSSIAIINNAGVATCKTKTGTSTIASVYQGITAIAFLGCSASGGGNPPPGSGDRVDIYDVPSGTTNPQTPFSIVWESSGFDSCDVSGTQGSRKYNVPSKDKSGIYNVPRPMGLFDYVKGEYNFTATCVNNASGKTGVDSLIHLVSNDPPPVSCPTDKKTCPDGSKVGRIPPGCEFPACPSPKTCTPKTEYSGWTSCTATRCHESGTQTMFTTYTAADCTKTSEEDTKGCYVACAPTCSLSANPTNIILPNYSTLSWNCSYAEYGCVLDQGIGGVGASGSKQVRPSKTTTYTLSCSGIDGSGSWPVDVSVGFTPTIIEVLPN